MKHTGRRVFFREKKIGDQPLLNCSASSRASRGDASCYFQGHVFLLTKEALGLGDGGNRATAPMLGGFCNLE